MHDVVTNCLQWSIWLCLVHSTRSFSLNYAQDENQHKVNVTNVLLLKSPPLLFPAVLPYTVYSHALNPAKEQAAGLSAEMAATVPSILTMVPLIPCIVVL